MVFKKKEPFIVITVLIDHDFTMQHQKLYVMKGTLF